MAHASSQETVAVQELSRKQRKAAAKEAKRARKEASARAKADADAAKKLAKLERRRIKAEAKAAKKAAAPVDIRITVPRSRRAELRSLLKAANMSPGRFLDWAMTEAERVGIASLKLEGQTEDLRRAPAPPKVAYAPKAVVESAPVPIAQQEVSTEEPATEETSVAGAVDSVDRGTVSEPSEKSVAAESRRTTPRAPRKPSTTRRTPARRSAPKAAASKPTATPPSQAAAEAADLAD